MTELILGTPQQAAFAAFYERHYALVLAYAHRRLPEDAARDVTAETFLVAWRRWEVAEPAGLRWLYVTAGHAVRTWQRSLRRSGALVHKVAAQPPSAAPDHAIEHAEQEAVLAVVRLLPELDRDVLLPRGRTRRQGRRAGVAVEHRLARM